MLAAVSVVPSAVRSVPSTFEMNAVEALYVVAGIAAATTVIVTVDEAVAL